MDNLAWNSIINDLGPALLRYFCASFPPALAEDSVQETLTRLVQKVNAGLFDPARGNIRMYAYGIAHFVRLEGLKSPRALPMELYPTDGNHAEDELARQRRVQELRFAIRQLTETQQNILSLYLDEEMTLENISILLEMPVGTVKSHLFRAKELLKEIMTKRSEGAL